MNQDSFALLAHFCYATHYTYVFQHCDSGAIHCLKYNHARIDWTYYAYEEWDLCKEYMIAPLDNDRWEFTED